MRGINSRSTLYEAGVDSQLQLKELVGRNPLLADIEVPAPPEEERLREREAERKIEAKQQIMEEIVRTEGGAVLEGPRPHVRSKTKKKADEEAKRAQELRKKHNEKMRQIRSQNLQSINAAFFSNAKGAIDENKGWACEFASTAPPPNDVATTSQPLASGPGESPSKDKQSEVAFPPEETKEAKEKLKESEIAARDVANIAAFRQEGEYVYELFAILVHSGSAFGGHYFAYIKDQESAGWLSYSDTMVRPLRIAEIQRVFGGVDAQSTAGSG